MDTIIFVINKKGVSSLELVGMKLMRLDARSRVPEVSTERATVSLTGSVGWEDLQGRQLEMGNLENR